MEEKKFSKIEDIKSNLYSRKNDIPEKQIEGELHNIKYNTNKDWSKEDQEEIIQKEKEMKKHKTSIFKKFFIIAIVFFVGALSFAYYEFSHGGVTVSSDNIDIAVVGNAFTKGGEELPLQIEITNKNKANLELANLIVSYPNGANNNIGDVTRLPKDSLGTIKPGESVVRNIKVKLFGEEKSIRNVSISLEYHPEGSNAIFTKNEDYSVTISSAPLSLFIDAPETTTSNQPFSFSVKTTLNSSLPKGNPTVLQLSYPSNFVFESAVPSPTFSNTTWDLSKLSAQEPITIAVKGRIIGQDGDEKVFHAYAGAVNPNNQSVVDVVYNSLLHSILIKKPFLEAKILVNNQDLPVYTTTSGEFVNASISWVNNLTSRITDAQIILSISGNVLDRQSIDQNSGFYDSANNQIIWDKNTTPELASIEPGGSGNVNFKFKSISLLGNSSLIQNPQMELSVSIKGRQPNYGSSFTNIDNFSKKIIKILSDFQIASSAVYSSGSLPPKAETETKYVVVWTLSNTSNIITGAKAKSALPIYVNWVGPLSGNNENISYNEVTREVTWDIGVVSSNTGFNSSREASFMISLKPSLSQVGSIPQLMKGISLIGTDSFSKATIKNKFPYITTSLINDPSFRSGDEKVIQ